MIIKTARREILLAYCLLRQGERSMAHVLHSRWSGVRQFYTPTRRSQILQCAVSLIMRSRLPPDTDVAEVRSQLESRRRRVWTPFDYASALLSRWTRTYLIDSRDLFYWGYTLRTLDEMLTQTEPDREAVARLRHDLWFCEFRIERRCWLLPGLKDASRVENYLQPPSLKHIEIDLLLSRFGR